MRQWYKGVAALCVLGSLAAWGQPGLAKTDASKLDKPDEQFLIKAAQGDLGEIEVGKLASKNGKDASVKSFGERLVKDHTQALEEVQAVAKKHDLTLPKETDKSKQASLKKLAKLKGEKFDQEFAMNMVNDHSKDVAEFKDEAKKAKAADVKDLAAKQTPVLEEHLKLAKETHDKVMPSKH